MPRVKIDYVVSFSNEDSVSISDFLRARARALTFNTTQAPAWLDRENQASNLLSWEVSKKRWLCSPGEPSCSVVLQLARAVKISSVQIGAHNTALLEVLVGRSETPSEPFQVLIPRSVFLSPAESRAAGAGAGAGADRVRSFSAGGGLGPAAAQRWDRVRLVCSQPYNKHCKYGVSFIHMFEPEGASGSAPSPLVPARVLALEPMSSDDEEFRPGELFAKYRAAGDPGTQIRQATSQALKNNPDASTKLVRTPLAKHKHRPTDNSDLSRDPQRDKRNLIYNKDDEQPHDKIDHIVQRHNDGKTHKHKEPPTVDKTPYSKRADPSTSRNSGNKTKLNEDKDQTIEGNKGAGKEGDKNSGKQSDKDGRKETGKDSGRKRVDSGGQAHKNGGSSSKKKEENRKRLHSDRDRAETSGALRPGPECDRPLQDVVFVLSGYQNPRRSRLRELAVSLGARYQREWGPLCTHLICAFNNTPKLLEVRSTPGGGEVPVPTGAWLEECGRSRRRLPCQWFAVEPELRVSPPPSTNERTPASEPQHSECDTDDEIEMVVQQKRARASRRDHDDDVQVVKDHRIQDNITVEWESGDETSVEDTSSAMERLRPETGLPPLLSGCAFLLDEALVAPLDVQLLRRYCIAYGGLVLKPSEMEDDSECLVMCGSAGCLQGSMQGSMPGLSTRARRVRADWLWACHTQQTLLPLDHYLLD